MKKTSGFTLVEVLAALVILMSVTLGIAKAYLVMGSEFKSLERQRNITQTLEELLVRSARNPSQGYFAQAHWQGSALPSSITPCDRAPICSNDELRDFDLAWAQAQLASQTQHPVSIVHCYANRTCLRAGAVLALLPEGAL